MNVFRKKRRQTKSSIKKHKINKYKINKYKINKCRLQSQILGALLIVSLFFSALFISEELGHHECTGDDCPICATIEMCMSNIRECGTGVILIVLAAVMTALPMMLISYFENEKITTSPVENKVRINF